jgi:hypothetical protein
MATAVLLGMIVAAFVGLLYASTVWRKQLEKLQLSVWRRRYATVGLIAVTIQAAIFIAFWTPIFRDDVLVVQWTKGELLVFIVAIPCVLAGKGPLRWWLLSSSAVLMMGSFFTALSA